MNPIYRQILFTRGDICPKCGGPLKQTGHGPYCPKATCKWGWEVEMDGSPLKPPVDPADDGIEIAVLRLFSCHPDGRVDYNLLGQKNPLELYKLIHKVGAR